MDGLTADRLSTLIVTALQTTLYLLPQVETIRMETHPLEFSSELMVFRNKAGKVCGYLPDLIWKAWLRGEVPYVMGKYEVDLRVPDDWLQIVDGIEKPIISVRVVIHVMGLVVESLGLGNQYMLFDAIDNKLEKGEINIEFRCDEAMLPLSVFDTEGQFEHFIQNRTELIHIVNRIVLPRLRWGWVFWPPSERAAKKATQLMRDYLEGRTPEPTSLDLAEIEGTDIAAIWEPIIKNYPSSLQHD